ncbi:MAG: hypothetical protein AAGK14_05305 [Verrucomicrobiota bacterium]
MTPQPDTNKVEEALSKITKMDGVKAAYVFDQYHTIVGRDVPAQYGNEILKRIAGQLSALAELSWQSGSATQEFRLTYEKFAVYSRLFGKGYFLVAFMLKELEPADMRQPINLAVLVLEKAIRSEVEASSSSAFSQIAQLAEKSIREQTEADESFAGMTRRHAIKLMGPLGRELVDNAIEDEVLVLPLLAEKDMRKLMKYVLARIPHPLMRTIMEHDMDDMLQIALKQK